MAIDEKKREIQELEELIRYHNRQYWILDNPEISDYEYDRLVNRLKELSPDSELLQTVGAGLESFDNLGNKIVHTEKMLSLDKCYTFEELNNWIANIKSKLVGSPKIDGMACMIRYDTSGQLKIAATRGDGSRGDDITANVLEINDIPNRVPLRNIEVRGEIYTKLSNFSQFSSEFKNARNFTAGTVKQKQGNRKNLKYLSFFAYNLLKAKVDTEWEKIQILKRLGFETVESELLKHDQSYRFYENILKRREKLNYEIDGVVFKANSVAEQKKLGNTAHHPRYAIALKFQGESGTTQLIDVIWNVSRTGTITPVAQVKPIFLSGAVISRCSLHNFGIFEKLNLHNNDTVLLMRRGGVIPNIEQNFGGGTKAIKTPVICPSCGAPINKKDDFLYCSSPEACSASRVNSLIHFATVFEFEGFGPKIVESLFNRDILLDPPDFFKLTKKQLSKINRMGELLSSKLIASVQSKKSVTLSRFLRSLGISELGKHASIILEKKYQTLDEIMSSSESQLSQIHTIGDITAHNIVTGLKEKKELIKELLKYVTIEKKDDKSTQIGIFAGKKILFTGKLVSIERKEAKKLVEQEGGQVPSSVTKDLDYLVVGDGGSPLLGEEQKSNKLKKAEKLISTGSKIKIVAEKDFLSMIATIK